MGITVASKEKYSMDSKLERYAAILGLSGSISLSDVKSAYRREMFVWHPDLHFGKATEANAHAKAQTLNEAYEFLSEITEDNITIDTAEQTVHAHQHYHTRHTYQNWAFTPGFPDPAVFEVFLKSSNVVSTGYDGAKRILFLKFQKGYVYRYFDVPRIIFDELLRADSHGRYANRSICHSFRYERCPPWSGRKTMA